MTPILLPNGCIEEIAGELIIPCNVSPEYRWWEEGGKPLKVIAAEFGVPLEREPVSPDPQLAVLREQVENACAEMSIARIANRGKNAQIHEEAHMPGSKKQKRRDTFEDFQLNSPLAEG